MDNASLKDFRGGEGAYMADVLERSLLLPTDMAKLGGLRRQEVFLSIKRYLGMVRLPKLVALLILGKTSKACGSIDSCSLVSHLSCVCFQLTGYPGYLQVRGGS